MWWKFPLLFLLSAPLAYRSWQEITSYSGIEESPITLPSRDNLAARKTQQLALAESVESNAIPEDLAAAVFRGWVEPPRTALTRPRPFTELASKLEAHLEEVARVRDFVETLVALEDDPARPPRFQELPYTSWLADRRQAVEGLVKNDIALQDRLRMLDEEIKAIIRRLQRSEMSEKKEIATELAAELEKLKADCRRFRALSDRAERKFVQASTYRELLGILLDEEQVLRTLLDEDGTRQAEKRLKPDERRAKMLDHLNRYDLLLRDDRIADDLQKLVRTQATRFCSKCLPPRIEEESVVLFYQHGAMGRAKTVARDELMVSWKDRPPGAKERFQALLDYDKDFEFRPPSNSLVDYYFLRPGGSTGYKIEPTPYNRAARYFNEQREEVAGVSEEELKTFLDKAPLRDMNPGDIPPPFLRVRVLLEAMEKHPRLFRVSK